MQYDPYFTSFILQLIVKFFARKTRSMTHFIQFFFKKIITKTKKLLNLFRLLSFSSYFLRIFSHFFYCCCFPFFSCWCILIERIQLSMHCWHSISIAGLSPEYLNQDSCWCTWKSNTWWPNYLGPCHSHCRSDWISWLLLRSRFGLVVVTFGEWTNRLKISYLSSSLFVSLSLWVCVTLQFK